jgi:predicted secreted Zn-dependent protease
LLAATLLLLFALDSGVSKAQASLAKDIPAQDSLIYLPLLNATDTQSSQPTVHTIAIDNATMDFYTVEGANEDEIRANMNSVRPGEEDAYTSWNFSWNAPDDGNGSCDLNNVQVNYTISVRFPQWTPPVDASAELIQKWNNYIDALAVHESGHVQRVFPFIPDLINNIKASSCDTYNQVAQEWLNGINQSNADYDTETNHGATQGAIFP